MREADGRAPASPYAGWVSLWAAIGLVWLVFCVQAYTRWVLDADAFRPAPIRGPDVYGDTRLVLLRVIEITSLAIAMATIWWFLIRPWRKTGRLTLDGMLVIGSLLACAIDPLINYFHYTFAWNAHAWNMGTWLGSFPLHRGPTRYGEGLVWFIPQYLYLGVGLASIGCVIVRALRRRRPAISDVRAMSVAFAVLFGLDIVLEQVFLRLGIYAFPRTWSALTLFAGKPYQFPVYESVFVGAYALGFMAVRLSVFDSDDSQSFVERGIHRWRPSLRTPIRLLAVCGFCAVWAAASYFIPWSWMSNTADSYVTPPSYMTPGQ